MRDEVAHWLERHNPLLMLMDMSCDTTLAARQKIKVLSDTEVLIIRGVDSVYVQEALDNGSKVLLVEDDDAKMAAFLQGDDLKPNENLFVSTSRKEQLYPIIKQFVFKKIQYEGDLRDVRTSMDGMMMSYSEYRNLGEVILPNILGNLLHISSYIDGRDLGELLAGEEVIICGNGISLKKGIAEIKQLKKRPIIFSVGSSLPVLLKEGIIPDFFAIIDPSPPVEIYKCLQDVSIPVFYQNRASKDVLHLHHGPKIFMGSSRGWQIEDSLMNEMDRENFSFDAGCHAGNFGAHVALSLGASQITLVGMDGVAKVGEEVSLEREGRSTRSDLYYGMDFFSLLLENFPGKKICHYTEGFSFEGATVVDILGVKGKSRGIELPKEKKYGDAESVIDRYFDHTMLETLGELMSKVKEETGLTETLSACVLAELSLEPLFLHFCGPMWEIWKNILPDSEDILAQITFSYNLLGRFTEKTGWVGGAFYLFGKKEGAVRREDANGVVREEGYYFNGKAEGSFCTYDEKGKLLVYQEMRDGLRHGKYQVFKGGMLVREGMFRDGICDGRHVCYHQGQIVDEISYEMGKKCGVHKIYSDAGVKVEEIQYKDGDFFDRYKFDENGSKVYSGVWNDGLFQEICFDGGIEVFKRLGKMVEGKLVFKGDHEPIY